MSNEGGRERGDQVECKMKNDVRDEEGFSLTLNLHVKLK